MRYIHFTLLQVGPDNNWRACRIVFMLKLVEYIYFKELQIQLVILL